MKQYDKSSKGKNPSKDRRTVKSKSSQETKNSRGSQSFKGFQGGKGKSSSEDGPFARAGKSSREPQFSREAKSSKRSKSSSSSFSKGSHQSRSFDRFERSSRSGQSSGVFAPASVGPTPTKVESFESDYMPVSWSWFADEALPTWVKKKYSPKESWKDKPFSKEDSHFFFKGIEELSLLFTEERSRNLPPYFQHPKYRSSYLLYFLPLQAAKFSTLFQLHPHAIQAALRFAEEKQNGVLRVADFGAGPGTASLSLLLLLIDLYRANEKEPPQVEFYWFDTNREIMEDGKALVREVEESFGILRGKVKVHAFVQPWWKAPAYLPDTLALSFLGHVLNESDRTPEQPTGIFWETLMKRSQGGGVLWVEPAARPSSQRLSQLRDSFFEKGLVESIPERIWGPCLHAGACPLQEGRDWCHFSIPTHIPGHWFKVFSEGLGSERQWVKFSYLWLATPQYPSRRAQPRLRRVVSDPMPQLQGRSGQQVLLCEPDRVGRMNVGVRSQIWRGDVVEVPFADSSKSIRTRK